MDYYQIKSNSQSLYPHNYEKLKECIQKNVEQLTNSYKDKYKEEYQNINKKGKDGKITPSELYKRLIKSENFKYVLEDDSLCQLANNVIEEIKNCCAANKKLDSINRINNNEYYNLEGLSKIIERRYRETASETSKAEYESFMRITPCHECGGQRLKKSALAVTVGGLNIAELTSLSIGELQKFMNKLELTKTQELIGGQILKEIRARIGFLMDVGLDYLTLARATGSLSGGEAQRIRLATQIGSGLVGVAYILDEPSIGLHQRDNDKLLGTLKHLRDLGNTLIVVEHDEDTMKEADYIVDIGPGAGEHGGKVIATGTAEEIMENENSITGAYLSGRMRIPVPEVRK